MTMRNPKFLILAVINASDQQTVNGLTRMQKLVFLTQREVDSLNVQTHSVDPHDYGPFSVVLYKHLQALITNGCVEKSPMETPGATERSAYTLTSDGETLFGRWCGLSENPVPNDDIRDIVREHETMPLLQLIKRVTTHHPETGVNCTLPV